MNLGSSYVQIMGRLARRRSQANAILLDSANATLTPWELRFLAESLLSNLWLDWNTFVKRVIVGSCNGSVTRSGAYLPPRATPDNSEARVCYEMKQYASGSSATPGRIYSGVVEP